jgi:hypothetical protein
MGKSRWVLACRSYWRFAGCLVGSGVVQMNDKTHFRKAFDSPYLSSADIVEPTTLTIKHVRLEPDKTKKTRDLFNTAYFAEQEIRKGEKLKPMILNSTNSKIIKQLTNSPFIEDWAGVAITVYVDPSVRFGKETVEGLRVSPVPPQKRKQATKQTITDDRLQAAIAKIKAGEYTEERLLEQFVLTEEQDKMLLEGLQ